MDSTEIKHYEYCRSVKRYFVRKSGRVALRRAVEEERRRVDVPSSGQTPRRAGFVSWAGGMVF